MRLSGKIKPIPDGEPCGSAESFRESLIPPIGYQSWLWIFFLGLLVIQISAAADVETPPEVISTTIATLASGKLNARTVSIRGRLLDHERVSVPATFKDRFTFESDNKIFEALCKKLNEEVESASSRRCPIHLNHTPSLPQVMADESLLRHLVTNLLDNAVRYSPTNTPVGLTVTHTRDDVRLQVIDQGAGIPEEDLPKLFTPFHRGSNTRGTPGTGLGMVCSKPCEHAKPPHAFHLFF